MLIFISFSNPQQFHHIVDKSSIETFHPFQFLELIVYTDISFDNLHNTIGSKALDDILPDLLNKMVRGKENLCKFEAKTVQGSSAESTSFSCSLSWLAPKRGRFLRRGDLDRL